MRIYSAEIRITATAYVVARSEREARDKIADLAGSFIEATDDGETFDGQPFDYDRLVSPKLSPAMTVDSFKPADLQVDVAEDLEEPDEDEPERDDEGRTAQDRYDDDCIEQYGCVELDNDLHY